MEKSQMILTHEKIQPLNRPAASKGTGDFKTDMESPNPDGFILVLSRNILKINTNYFPFEKQKKMKTSQLILEAN